MREVKGDISQNMFPETEIPVEPKQGVKQHRDESANIEPSDKGSKSTPFTLFSANRHGLKMMENHCVAKFGVQSTAFME